MKNFIIILSIIFSFTLVLFGWIQKKPKIINISEVKIKIPDECPIFSKDQDIDTYSFVCRNNTGQYYVGISRIDNEIIKNIESNIKTNTDVSEYKINDNIDFTIKINNEYQYSKIIKNKNIFITSESLHFRDLFSELVEIKNGQIQR